jgi:hypothetical protein
MTGAPGTTVHIQLQRVQSWLFSVPRLRAMVGANAMLGELLRIHLPDLTRATNRPWLLQKADGPAIHVPGRIADPLQSEDDPAGDAAAGILSRDGGHFEAVFASGATAFVEAARTLLQQSAAGLTFSVAVNGVRQEGSSTYLSTEIPMFAPCEWTGRGLASVAGGKHGNLR